MLLFTPALAPRFSRAVTGGVTLLWAAVLSAFLGLKGDVPALLRAISIMLEVQPAVEAKADAGRQKREDLIARLERMGLPTEALRDRPMKGD